MNEDELARQLEQELEAARSGAAAGKYNLPPEVRQRLGTAKDLARVDFSQGSPLRHALRARLAEKARRTLPGAFRRKQIARWLNPALAGAGLVALALLLIFGISLISRGRLPVPAAPETLTPSPTPYPPPATATTTPEIPTLTPSPLPFPPPGPGDEKHMALDSGLCIEEFALTGAPELDPLKFTLLNGGENGVVGSYPDIFFLPSARLSPSASEIDADGHRSIKANLGSEQLSAVLLETSRSTNADGSVFLQEAVQVMRGDQVIYTTQPADASPIDPLRGLWTYGDHWVLEYARTTNVPQADNSIGLDTAGQIIQDGELLNETRGYEEAFGFQLFNSKPFYFFQRDGQIGVVYDGQETLLGYERIPHYQCCSGAEENPRQYAGGVTFFAERGGTYYYVAIGVNAAETDAEQAQVTLSQFLANLAGGQDDAVLYDAATQLYGGSWADLESQYPDAGGDHFTLFQKACAPGGYYFCLKVLQLSPPEKLAEGRYRLWAQFSKADGSLWSSDYGQSWYDFEVVRGPGGQWRVMDPPPTGLGFREVVAHLSMAETAGLDGAGILRALWEDYMQRCQFTLLDEHQRLLEYEIVEVKEDSGLIALRQEKGLDLVGTVVFSVRPVKMEYSDWVAGNGEIQGEWVRSKFLFIGFSKDGDAVHLRIIGTGP